ncbi:NDP-sugar synthase [Parasediminibacterium sp. JCM 36343]|uniref:nucleotidyltransferase family protein n=1 Tax=Parasediminibacterium sp. JCM 36343 TaxID=3374279 RepID=UPI00397E6D11
MKAILFSAGLGSRLKPLTLHRPKALVEINGKTLLERNIAYLQQHGITDVIVNVHHYASQIIDAVNYNKGWGSNIAISDETDALLETGGGLKKAAWFFEGEEDFVVMNTDILTNMPLTSMIAQHQKQKPLATLAVSERSTSRYFLFNEANSLCGWRNVSTLEEKGPVLAFEPQQKKALKQLAFSGIHVISTRLFPLMQQEGKFSMVEVYLDLCASNRINSFNHTGSILVDVGKPESIEKAESIFM